jgi:hypothetical protein
VVPADGEGDDTVQLRAVVPLVVIASSSGS